MRMICSPAAGNQLERAYHSRLESRISDRLCNEAVDEPLLSSWVGVMPPVGTHIDDRVERGRI